MPDYQIDIRHGHSLRVGQDDTTVVTFEAGRFIQDLKGQVGNDTYALKLPAPWRGMRYRLQQNGREIASAGRPTFSARIMHFELEMPGRKLELVAQEQRWRTLVLSEGGEEIGRFTMRDVKFLNEDEWDADFHVREDSVGFAALVAWIAREWRGSRA